MKLARRQIKAFQNTIFSWWKINKRDLPWRHTHDPYKILVSEVMLQQTQVIRVLPKYAEFIKAYPTVEILAKSSPAAVLRIWKGMGYNRRAINLHKAARILVEKYQSIFPISEHLLSQLPGLGTYTARAILVFAYKQEVPLIDTNIRQIITHFFLTKQAQGPALRGPKGRALENEIEDIARQLIPSGKSWEWHQALMDYGALRLRDVKRPFAQGKLPKKIKPPTPFRQSNRFYRGRIIDLLREQEMTEIKLSQELIHTYHKPKAFFDTIIGTLLSDGLIERVKRNTFRLPEA